MKEDLSNIWILAARRRDHAVKNNLISTSDILCSFINRTTCLELSNYDHISPPIPFVRYAPFHCPFPSYTLHNLQQCSELSSPAVAFEPLPDTPTLRTARCTEKLFIPSLKVVAIICALDSGSTRVSPDQAWR